MACALRGAGGLVRWARAALAATLPGRPAGAEPVKVTVQAQQRYFWCACGLSQRQPFCDGTHRAHKDGPRPLRWTPEHTQDAWLCMCKQTQHPHGLCDGSHARLSSPPAGQ